MAAYLANVGANAAHPLRSPLRADGSFTVYTIGWRATRTEQQTIASHTRAVRRLDGAAERRARELWNPR